ncbi:MAG: sporulation protein YabP [Epulopiscium sp.]|nr:sporulation protein YabP [Candidatus Epulonipiscium sp.]
MDERKVQGYEHTLFLREREKISITGVLDVLTFDEETVILETERGMLTLRGLQLHIQRLDLEKQELELQGDLDSLMYSDSHTYGRSGGSFLSKLFK